METWRHGDIETWRYGDIETWRHGDIETWRHGDMETWRHEDMETFKTWRYGDIKRKTKAQAIFCLPFAHRANPFANGLKRLAQLWICTSSICIQIFTNLSIHKLDLSRLWTESDIQFLDMNSAMNM
jgi:hypothetical protein